MYQPLVPCPACRRHVRAEASCPFCGGELPGDLASRAVPNTTRRLSRAAAFVFGAALATPAATGCGGDVVSEKTAGGSDDGNGGAGGNGATGSGGSDDVGGSGSLYGGPVPRDAGVDAPDDDGGGGAEYGGPPGTGGNGGDQPVYGAPPPRD